MGAAIPSGAPDSVCRSRWGFKVAKKRFRKEIINWLSARLQAA